jgi:hypothetical protein
MELRYLAERSEPEPPPEVTRAALGELLRQLNAYYDHLHAPVTLATVLDLSGPGGDRWTLRAANGRSTVEPGDAADADLRIALDIVAFAKLWNGKIDLAQAIASGEARVTGQVSDGDKLALFNALYPTPDPDTLLPAEP